MPVPGNTFQSQASYVSAINKTKQNRMIFAARRVMFNVQCSNSKTPNQRLSLSIILTYWTMETPQNVLQNVHREPYVAQFAERRWVTRLTNGCNYNSTHSVCFSFARCHLNKTSQVWVLHRIRWKCNVVSRVDSGISSPNFIKFHQSKIKLCWKFSGFVFPDTVYYHNFLFAVFCVYCRS